VSAVTHLQHELFVDAPPERVFDLLAQPERTPQWSPNVIAVRRTSEGPIAVGSTTEVVVKVLGTRQRAAGRCTVFEPPRRLVIESVTDLGAKSRSETELSPEGNGTRLRATLDYTVPGGGLGRALDRLVAERQTRQDFEQGLRRFKQMLENGAT
jgi:uncharacterized protein YndB with AHSA1/START domain